MRIRGEPNKTEHCIEYGAGPGWITEKIVSIAVGKDARAVVTINGQIYAGFDSVEAAQAFVRLAKGDVDGNGRRVATHHGTHWPAIEGKTIDVVPWFP